MNAGIQNLAFYRTFILLLLGLFAIGHAGFAKQPALAQLPVLFVKNKGQWKHGVRFMAQRGPLVAAFEQDGIRLYHAKEAQEPVYLCFEGALPGARLIGEGQPSSHLNFFLGNDPKQWQAKVPSYGMLRYQNLYPGVDMRVREQAGRLEYDLLLSPKADLASVVVHCQGIKSLQLGEDGSLLLNTERGVLRQSSPTTWEVLPDGSKRLVECRFRVIDAQRYGFEAPSWNRDLELVIDPGLEWSTYLGGSGMDQVTTVAAAQDGSGDLFVAGYMNSVDFPLFSAPDFTFWQNKVFVARFDATGTTLRWATFLGGWHSQVIHRGLAAAPDGGAVIVGETASPDFPTTAGAFDRTPRFEDAFVARLDASGGLVFSTRLGGWGKDEGWSVGFDPAGNIVVGGTTSSADFPTTAGAIDRSYSQPTDASRGDAHGDIFIARFTPAGQLTYSTYLGGPQADILEDIAVDSQGNVTLVGWVTGHNVQVFVTTPDAFDRTWNGSQDCVLARLRLDGAGSADLKYSTLIGGSNMDNFYAVAVDPANPEIVTAVGMSWSDDFPTTPGVVSPTNPRFSDLFESQAALIARFHLPAGGPGRLLWSTYYGPTLGANIRATDVTVNQAGEPIVVGLMGDRDFETTRGAFDRLAEGVLNGGNDFISRLSPDGTHAIYASYFGGRGVDSDSIYVSPAVVSLGGNTVAVASSTSSPDFPVTPGAYDTTLNNIDTGTDGFLFRFTTEPDNSGDLTVGVPTLLSPANGARFGSGSFTARLQWTDVLDPSGIDGYEFEMSTSPDFSNAIDGTAHDNMFLMTSMSLSTWYWRVRAADKAGNLGPWSATSTFTLNAGNGQPTITHVGVFPNSIGGGASAVGVLYLDKPAPPGGLTAELSLHYNNSIGYSPVHLSAPASVPATVFIPEGEVTVLFDVATTPVERTVALDLYATVGGLGAFSQLTVKVAPSVEVFDLVIEPRHVTGGNPAVGSFRLKEPAPPGGAVVHLFSSHPQAARVPASVFLPEGATKGSFPITTFPVAFDIDSTIDVSTSSSLQRQYVFVKPADAVRLSSFTITPSNIGPGIMATGRVTFNAPVVAATWPAFDGAKVNIASSQPALAGHAPFITVWSGETTESFTFMARSAPTNSSITFTASYDGIVLTAPVNVSAGPPVSIASVTLNVSTVRGGQGGVATVHLSAPAPRGGITLEFSSSDPAIYFSSTPSFFISEGSTSGMAAFLAKPVSSTVNVLLLARYGSSSAGATVTVTPSDAVSRWVTSVKVSPSTVPGGTSATGMVTINTPAPSGGLPVQLSAGSFASVPPSVTIPAGATSATFTVTTVSVSSNVLEKIYGLLNFSLAAALTITRPPAPPPTPSAPTLLSPANDAIVAQPVRLDWNDVANAMSYEIQIDNSSTIASPFVANQMVSASEVTLSGLPAQRLWWRVRARNSAGVFGPFSTIRRFTPQAAPAAPSLSSVTLNPNSVVEPNSSQGTVTLSAAAPSGGAVVTLASNNTNAIVPASVTVPAGATTATFTITTRSVSASVSAAISATYNSVTRTAALAVNPPSTGTLPAPSLSSPASDARFAPGQNITFDWSDVPGAASYTIQIDDNNSFPSPWIVNQTVTSSTYSTSTLPTRTMWWRVRANNSSGSPGSWSSVRRFEVKD